MPLNLDNFRDEFLNDDKSLKEENLLVYTYSAGLSGLTRSTSLLIYKDLSFEIKLLWYKYPLPKRLNSTYKNNLVTKDIVESINELNDIEKLELKELYSTFTGKYIPEDASHTSLYFQHKGKTHAVNMSSYLMGKELFVTKEEQLVLKIHNLISEWEIQLFESIKNIHQ